MKMDRRIFLSGVTSGGLLASLASSSIQADADDLTPETGRLPDQDLSIQSVSWLEGRWIGEGFGGVLEEIWSPPSGNQMIGHFRMSQDDQPVFYELVLIEYREGGLWYRVKHFNPDFVGWEEKDAFHEFGWVGITSEEVTFDGLVLRRIDANTCDHVISVRDADGALREEVLRYRRAT